MPRLWETRGSFLSFSTCRLQMCFSGRQQGNWAECLWCAWGMLVSYIWFKFGGCALYRFGIAFVFSIRINKWISSQKPGWYFGDMFLFTDPQEACPLRLWCVYSQYCCIFGTGACALLPKGPESKYFLLCEPYGLCHKSSALPLWPQTLSEQMSVAVFHVNFTHKNRQEAPLQTLAHGPSLANPWFIAKLF